MARAAGDGVFAGSINGAGALEVRVTRAVARDHAGAHAAAGRGGAVVARAQPGVRGVVRAHLHAGGGRGRVPGRGGAAARWRGDVRRVGLPRARAARDRVPLRARHLHAGVDRLRAHRGLAGGRAGQGRRPPGGDRPGARDRLRQDGHADPRRSRRSRTWSPSRRRRRRGDPAGGGGGVARRAPGGRGGRRPRARPRDRGAAGVGRHRRPRARRARPRRRPRGAGGQPPLVRRAGAVRPPPRRRSPAPRRRGQDGRARGRLRARAAHGRA